mmetsp:Transcript_83214/g.178391  ORF Transcript_83214/g.178391 Transcript_83214/m.178391 type:complete len:1016 (-) Transcript_83214:6-3053(-)
MCSQAMPQGAGLSRSPSPTVVIAAQSTPCRSRGQTTCSPAALPRSTAAVSGPLLPHSRASTMTRSASPSVLRPAAGPAAAVAHATPAAAQNPCGGTMRTLACSSRGGPTAAPATDLLGLKPSATWAPATASVAPLLTSAPPPVLAAVPTAVPTALPAAAPTAVPAATQTAAPTAVSAAPTRAAPSAASATASLPPPPLPAAAAVAPGTVPHALMKAAPPMLQTRSWAGPGPGLARMSQVQNYASRREVTFQGSPSSSTRVAARLRAGSPYLGHRSAQAPLVPQGVPVHAMPKAAGCHAWSSGRACSPHLLLGSPKQPPQPVAAARNPQQVMRRGSCQDRWLSPERAVWARQPAPKAGQHLVAAGPHLLCRSVTETFSSAERVTCWPSATASAPAPPGSAIVVTACCAVPPARATPTAPKESRGACGEAESALPGAADKPSEAQATAAAVQGSVEKPAESTRAPLHESSESFAKPAELAGGERPAKTLRELGTVRHLSRVARTKSFGKRPCSTKPMPQVCEDRSYECVCRAVFLLADDRDGRSFMADFLASCSAPVSGSPPIAEGIGDGPLGTERSRVLVPCGDSTALLALQQLKPMEALLDIRQRTSRLGQASPPRPIFGSSERRRRFSPVPGLPELPDGTSARSTLLAYVVQGPSSSPLGLDRQLTPIFEVESAYDTARASGEFAPRRLVVVSEGSLANSSDMPAGEEQGTFAREVASRLSERGVDDIEVVSLVRGDSEGLQNLAKHIVEALADSNDSSLSDTPRPTTAQLSTDTTPPRCVPDNLGIPAPAAEDEEDEEDEDEEDVAEAIAEAPSPASQDAPLSHASTPRIVIADCEFMLNAEGVAAGQAAQLWQPGNTMTMVTPSHVGTPLMCPQGGFERGLLSLAPNQQGSLVPVYWARVPSGDSVVGAPAAIQTNPEEQAVHPAISAPPNYQGIATVQPKTAAQASGMVPAATAPVPEASCITQAVTPHAETVPVEPETDRVESEPELPAVTAAGADAAGADNGCTAMSVP